MINFKRDIYKLKAPPRPPKPVASTNWYISKSQNGRDVDYCSPITIQIYKNPNSSIIDEEHSLFYDQQENVPVGIQNSGLNNTYTISNQIITNPVGLNIQAVRVNSFGLIEEIIEGSCNPELTLQPFYITIPYNTSSESCNKQLTLQVKINSQDINPNTLILNGLYQLYKGTSSNTAPQLLNPIQDIPGFSSTGPNFIGFGFSTSVLEDYSIFSAQLGSNGVIFNGEYCTT